jgi:1,4-alpha-glucan branching enzyme
MSDTTSLSHASDLAPFLFHQGTNFRAHDYLGAHRAGDGVIFRVWAPNAAHVFIVGDFCTWETGIPMNRITSSGIWEGYAPGARDGMPYKFRVVTHDGRSLYKADPYARASERVPANASVLYTSNYTWRDASWLAHRQKTMTGDAARHQPINIYELHLGSWMRHEDGTYLSYTELSH